MALPAFTIGEEFTVLGDQRWRVTDVGTRVIVAIPVKDGWMDGPPYAQHETVFDENDFPALERVS